MRWVVISSVNSVTVVSCQLLILLKTTKKQTFCSHVSLKAHVWVIPFFYVSRSETMLPTFISIAFSELASVYNSARRKTPEK